MSALVRVFIATNLLGAMIGCGSQSASPSPEAETAIRVDPVHLRVSTAGGAAIVFDEDTDLRVVRAPTVQPGGLLSVATDDHLLLADGGWLSVNFNLLNYGGPGDYELGNVRSSQTKSDQAALEDSVVVTYVEPTESANQLDTAPVETIHEFGAVLEPCAVHIGKDELSGVLQCRALASSDGDAIRLRMEWEPQQER